MFTVEEICEEQERQYNRLMQEDDQYCHPESFKWGFEHGLEYALTKLGWHPASEPPEEGKEVMVICYIDARRAFYTGGIYYSKTEGDGKLKYYPNVKWWCYPPKEE